MNLLRTLQNSELQQKRQSQYPNRSVPPLGSAIWHKYRRTGGLWKEGIKKIHQSTMLLKTQNKAPNRHPLEKRLMNLLRTLQISGLQPKKTISVSNPFGLSFRRTGGLWKEGKNNLRKSRKSIRTKKLLP